MMGRVGVEMPEEVVRATAERYREAFGLLTGKRLEEVVGEE
jgi:phosphoribosylaminoimidazole-succinocarboxamide synthase